MIIAQEGFPQASWVREMVDQQQVIAERRERDFIALVHEQSPYSLWRRPQGVDPQAARTRALQGSTEGGEIGDKGRVGGKERLTGRHHILVLSTEG